MVGVLEEVARCGFSPLDKDDALAHVLTKSNTCTFLTDDTKEFFVDPEVRLERSGVTASTQLVRVLIPVVLQQRKPRRRTALRNTYIRNVVQTLRKFLKMLIE